MRRFISADHELPYSLLLVRWIHTAISLNMLVSHFKPCFTQNLLPEIHSDADVYMSQKPRLFNLLWKMKSLECKVDSHNQKEDFTIWLRKWEKSKGNQCYPKDGDRDRSYCLASGTAAARGRPSSRSSGNPLAEPALPRIKPCLPGHVIADVWCFYLKQLILPLHTDV